MPHDHDLTTIRRQLAQHRGRSVTAVRVGVVPRVALLAHGHAQAKRCTPCVTCWVRFAPSIARNHGANLFHCLNDGWSNGISHGLDARGACRKTTNGSQNQAAQCCNRRRSNSCFGERHDLVRIHSTPRLDGL
jgi:hypothetical protein